jgi:hypothetical protein
MNRLFICTCFQFPFGDASSNYVRNFALSIKLQGWEVIVFGRGKERDADLSKEGYIYQGIRYDNVDVAKSGAKNFLYLYFCYHVYLAPLFKKYNLSHNDYIYIYSDFLDMARYAQKILPVTHITYSAVEWFQPFQYKHGRIDPRYVLWKYSFNYKTRKLSKVFPISLELERYYTEHGCRTCLLPALIDGESEKSDDVCLRKDGITNFIYSGVGTNKDSLDCMIGAMFRMSENLLSKIRLHFTILNEEELKSVLGRKAYQLDTVRESLIFHGWLEYDDLLELYRDMDFVLIARKENKVTVSNFPSKIPELMNFGVIPVCSDVGDYTKLYLTDGKDAIFFKGADEKRCCAAMEKAVNLSSENLLEMKRNAMNCVKTCLSYHQWRNKIESFIVS